MTAMSDSERDPRAAAISTALAAETQEQADAALKVLLQFGYEDHGLDQESALRGARMSLAYCAGYHSHDVRRRTERLYKCAHPIFGAIEHNTPPTPEQSFKLGEEMSARKLGNKAIEWARMSYLVPRVDAARECLDHTGVYLRAIGTDGKWGSYDIAQLTRDSLIGWLDSGDKAMLVRLVLALFGHRQDNTGVIHDAAR